MSEPRPERIAAAARALGGEFGLRLALYADAIAESLARELCLVSWDRQEVIGHAQADLGRLREQRFRNYGGPAVRIVERRRQPLECFEPAWRALRQGRRVRVDFERGACSSGLELLRGMARTVGYGVLSVATDPIDEGGQDETVADHEDGGVILATPRVALIGAEADEELAAYVVARACLRRSGVDPRAVRVAYSVGTRPRLRRHLLRLFVGARFGPATDPQVFAGPADAVTRDDYLAALTRWEEDERAQVLCEGGILERSGDVGPYLAPAVFRVEAQLPDLPLAGPMLVLVEGDEETCVDAFRQAGAAGVSRLEILGAQRQPAAAEGDGPVKRVRGALLVD